MIKDRNIAFQVKREFIHVAHMTGLAVDRLESLGGGAAVFQEIVAAAELSGLAIAADGDEIYHLWKIPWDLDRDQPLQARLWFTHSSTDADDPDWLVELKGLAVGAAPSDAGATPDEALTFPALAVSTTADALEKTSWQSTGSNAAIAAADIFMQMMIECNAMVGSANEISLLGIELAYVVKMTDLKREFTDVALGTLY